MLLPSMATPAARPQAPGQPRCRPSPTEWSAAAARPPRRAPRTPSRPPPQPAHTRARGVPCRDRRSTTWARYPASAPRVARTALKSLRTASVASRGICLDAGRRRAGQGRMTGTGAVLLDDQRHKNSDHLPGPRPTRRKTPQSGESPQIPQKPKGITPQT
jgi:hypothetical protein